jgi:hypothetical protein
VNTSDSTEESRPDADAAPQMSEEEAREYVKRLRATPVEHVVTDLLFGALNAAQSKIGRRDGRLMIDLSAVMLEHVRPHVPGELSTQVDQVIGQLRLGQVQAEQDLAASGSTEPGDLKEMPPPPSPSAATPTPPQQPQQPPKPKLWIPGRD